MTLTPGQSGDAPWGRRLLAWLGPQVGQPQLLADRADEDNQTRALAAELGWELVTPPKAYRRAPWSLDRTAYRGRNVIERYFGRIKRLRGVSNRYHKLARVFFNQILLACIHFMTK